MPATAARARRPSSPTLAWGLGRALAVTVTVAFAAGCGTVSADVLAVWVDGSFDENGNRELQIYDAGERRSVLFEPTIPGSATDLLQMATDSRGGGVIVSGVSDTLYVDLRQGRRGRLSATLDETRDISPDFSVLKGGDALIREFFPRSETNGRRRVALMPLSTRFGLVPTLLDSPAAPEPGARWELLSATDAPVLFWVEARGTPRAANGRIQAVTYPSAHAPVLGVPEPTALAVGTVEARPVDEGSFPDRIDDTLCPHRVCSSPSGRFITTMGPDPCTLMRWDWTQALAPQTPLPAERVDLPGACPRMTDPTLVATIADNLVVMDDDTRLYLFDLTAATTKALPKVGRGRSVTVRATARGDAILWILASGVVLRVDGFGPRIVSTQRSFCAQADDIALSPSGHWVVLSCNGQSPTESGPDGLLLRISALGLEQYPGINMAPLAVDDDGSALLYSFDGDDSDSPPRGLFVLGGDGALSRVDDLEPGPGPIAIPDAEGRQSGVFFDATALPP